jgi:hypothetical protein
MAGKSAMLTSNLIIEVHRSQNSFFLLLYAATLFSPFSVEDALANLLCIPHAANSLKSWSKVSKI